jgi:peroxiredoxin
MAALKVGDAAPDFELAGVLGERRRTFRLSEYRGRTNIVLVFYVLDWSPV